jgi:hypothetical protein
MQRLFHQAEIISGRYLIGGSEISTMYLTDAAGAPSSLLIDAQPVWITLFMKHSVIYLLAWCGCESGHPRLRKVAGGASPFGRRPRKRSKYSVQAKPDFGGVGI